MARACPVPTNPREPQPDLARQSPGTTPPRSRAHLARGAHLSLPLDAMVNGTKFYSKFRVQRRCRRTRMDGGVEPLYPGEEL